MLKHFSRSVTRLQSCLLTILLITLVASTADAQGRRRGVAGKPFEIQVTPYKTTMLANGKDEVSVKVVVIDGVGTEMKDAVNPVRFSLKGDARITRIQDGSKADAGATIADTSAQATFKNGLLWVTVVAGRTLGHIKFEAKADSLWPGSTEIHTVQPGKAHVVTTAKYTPKKFDDKILGADISFLPQLEDRGMKFSDKGTPGDAIQIMKDHGFNYIRLRIFNAPANPKGYSPNKGFCDLEHTKAMAKRIKAAGMKFLLDFHYSDYWADPQQQNKPAAWVGQDFTTLKKSVHDYTVDVMKQLKDQGTTPDMVQVGNEINHGMIWPEGAINNLDSLSQLLYAGITGVKAVSPSTIIMIHIALGGQSEESKFFLDNMKARNLPFDVIGLSYYPKWHGTLEDLKNNMADLSTRYPQKVMVAEYSQLKKEVNDVSFNVPNSKAVGSFIWEPISSWEGIFDRDGKSNQYMDVYPEIAKKYTGK
ncbi:MAG TPA: glycosyl hydrolase 53 family protein [Mucilaginibacter sp.]|nr:glycosyl hydrolase 53 family protein [Mucilaginibacter sp.]